MKKTQRILALIGVILLVLMYASTLIFAFIDHSASMGFFKLSIAGTFFIPVIIYAMTLFHKLATKDSSEDSEHSEDNI